jgi:hypothetical protein
MPDSVARWQHGSQMFCYFYLARNHKIANNSTTDEAREKNKHRVGIIIILEKNNNNYI